MNLPPPDGSRDRRIEDLSNLYLIHPAARALLPWALRRGVSANAVSVAGLLLGIAATAAYSRWQWWPAALVGLVFSVGWLIADGLDGMVARATGTASVAGRVLDGVVDHGVFILIYVTLATSLGTGYGWTLAILAGAAHILQSMLFEGERARFHRRLKLQPAPPREGTVPVYDAIARAWDRTAERFDALLAHPALAPALAQAYGEEATAPMRWMALLSANVRVAAICAACLLGRPTLFWWFEIGPLTLVLAVTAAWHRVVEARLARQWGGAASGQESRA